MFNTVYLTDNSSNYTKCYPAMRFGDFSTGSGMFNDNRTLSLLDIPIRPINNEIENFSGTRYGYSESNAEGTTFNFGVTSDRYLQTFRLNLWSIDQDECPVRPSEISNLCPAFLMPGNIFKVRLNQPLSDLAGNIMNSMWLGGKFNTSSQMTNTSAGESDSSFKTVERPYVSNTFPADGSEGQLLNLNPRITFSLPSKNFIDNTTPNHSSPYTSYSSYSYYELYKNDLEKMVNLNEDYSIINPTNNTPTIPLSHKCLTADNSSSNTKGTISFEPIPKGGYDFGYLDDFLLSTITIRPNSNLEPNTKYTITVNNLTNDSSFCRPLEKIVMLDNYSFSFTTVDNVTPSLVGYYTFNDVNATTLNDHADEDNNQSFQDATLISTATLHKGFNQRDNGTIKLDGNFAKINNNFPSVDNFTISVWSMNGSQTYPIIGWDANNSLSIPEFKLHVENNNIKVKLGSNTITCSKIVQRNIWNHIVVSVKNGEQNLYLNGLFCQDGTTSGTFKIASPIVFGDFQKNYNSVGNSYSNGYIDEFKIFNNYLESGEVKTLFINTGRNLEGFYPLGNRISNGNVLDFSGNNFTGTICDALPCNNITSIASRQNYEKKSNHASLLMVSILRLDINQN